MFDADPDDASRPQAPSDPAIGVAERHLRLLAEVATLAMEAARASSALVVTTAQAANKIVDEVGGAWACEMDKARAVHAHRDAADAFSRITRALRLSLTLETATAERLRDLRTGVTPARADRAEAAAQLGAVLGPVREKVRELVADADADDGDIDPALDLAHELRERLFETDRFGPLLRRPLLEVVAGICADIGVAPDWSRWSAGSPPDERKPSYVPPSLCRREPRLAEAPTPHPRE